MTHADNRLDSITCEHGFDPPSMCEGGCAARGGTSIRAAPAVLRAGRQRDPQFLSSLRIVDASLPDPRFSQTLLNILSLIFVPLLLASIGGFIGFVASTLLRWLLVSR